MTDTTAWIDKILNSFDFPILSALHDLAEWGGQVLTPIFQAISFMGEYGIAVLLLAAILLFFPKTRAAGICMVVAVVIGFLLTNVILKEIVARPRPFADNASVYYDWWRYVGAPETADKLSFPSGHVTAVMAGITALAFMTRKPVVWTGFLFVVLMSVSRCYLMVHYPSDVLAGILTGAAAALLAYAIVDTIQASITAYKQKWRPINFVEVKTPEDIAQLSLIAHEIWHEYWPSLIGLEQTEYMIGLFHSQEALLRDINENGYRFWILKIKRRVVGYTGARHEVDKEKLFISKIYLYAHERSKGYASQVFQFYEKYCNDNNLSAMYLSVYKGNELAISTYKAKEFLIVDSVAKSIGNGFVMDDFIMEKTLDAS